ncbi:MAG: aldehyde dehydrogenase family protein, partial [Planctomycetota bacterium]
MTMTEHFNQEHFNQMVPGAEASGTLEVHAPFDNSLIATIDTGDRNVVEQALSTAQRMFRDRDAWLPTEQRIAILERTGVILAERRDELALEAAREGGKPLMDSQVEVDRAIDGIRECIDGLRTQAGRGITMGINRASLGRMAFTHHEPIGVVVAFSAFNHPVNLIVHQVGPAIAVGCPVIVKPAKATPLSCWRVVSILREAGLPEEW